MSVKKRIYFLYVLISLILIILTETARMFAGIFQREIVGMIFVGILALSAIIGMSIAIYEGFHDS